MSTARASSILVPLDGSALAEQALWVAARLAHRLYGVLHIVTVRAPVPPAGDETGESTAHVGNGREVRHDLREYLEGKAGELATTHGVRCSCAVRALRLYGENKADDPALRREPCSVIDIAIVRIEGARVRGTLAPYWDPDCDCRTQTVFEGELAQDHIAGTFTSRRDTDPATPVAGHWFADRQRE